MDPILTIAEASRQIAAKQISPVELTQACLDRVKRLNDTLHAFILPTQERAMADARAAEARIMAGLSRGPLDGIPVGHKDIYNTAGIRTTGHSRLLEHNVPERDATVVRKWAEAGTVMMARRTSSPWAARRSTCPGRRRAIPGTRSTSPAAPPPAPARRWRPA
jgi:aspartyl-tRNA(Asn)/glutamyl-tRNA(Gln) amidotransferase subunit A